MQVEIFEQKELGANLTIFDNWDRRVQLIRELGLKGQESWIEAYEKAKTIPFKWLSAEDLAIWSDFLPTSYLDDNALLNNPDDPDDSLRLQDYKLDFIPLKVLEVWSECKLQGYFTSYQIRSAENDPILIGIIGPLRFLIARWGESLKPFEEIKERKQRREARKEWPIRMGRISDLEDR